MVWGRVSWFIILYGCTTVLAATHAAGNGNVYSFSVARRQMLRLTKRLEKDGLNKKIL